MAYDLFISYSRRDNQQGRITEFVECIQTDFARFAARSLKPFFDLTDIHGMDDWRHRILQGLSESRLLLACLSPCYLDSEYCEWEFNEYLKHEVGRTYFGDGVAPIYFVEVPGWEDKGFEQQCAVWVAELRRRQRFDLRPWFHAGEESLRDAAVQERMRELNIQLKDRIIRGERAEHSLGNVDVHNPHFIGRTTELRRLRETVALGKVGVLTAVHGLGGVGKTALAIEYAHAFAHEYGGGRWLVRCEGKEDLRATIAELAAPLALEFHDDEKQDTDRQYQRVLAELHRLADSHEPHRGLLLLDNVDKPRLLEPAQTQRLPAGEWLHVIATTRLGESELYGRQKDRAFLPVDELPEADALELIETYQPGGAFPSDIEREAAREIVNLLGRFTLAVETAAVYLGQFADDVTCTDFLARLKKEGLTGLDAAAEQTTEGVRHGEKRLAATLAPTLGCLTESEKLALNYASLLPADHIALPWIRTLVAEKFPELGKDAEPGYPDPWKNLLRRLFSLRLLHPTDPTGKEGHLDTARMHRLIQSMCREKSFTKRRVLRRHIFDHAKDSAEAEFLFRQVLLEAEDEIPRHEAHVASAKVDLGQLLLTLGRFSEAEPLIRQALETTIALFGEEHTESLTVMNLFAWLSQQTGDMKAAEWAFRKVLAAQERGLGPTHPGVAISCLNLALVEQALGNFVEAEQLLRRALDVSEQVLGPDHPNTLTSINNLVALLETKGDYAAAEPLYRRALASCERVLGPAHPTTLTSVHNLAGLLYAKGDYAAAEPLYRRALAVCEQVLGPSHPAVADSLNNLAEMYHAQGRYAEAEPLYRRVLAGREQALGPTHPNTLSTLTSINDLALLLKTKGDLAAAEPLYRLALARREQALGPTHPDTLNSVNNLAALLWAKGDYGNARALFEQLIDFGYEIPSNRLQLARIALITGKIQASREQVSKAWKGRAEAPPYVIPRILWFQLTFALLDGVSPTPFLGRLKTALSAKGAHAAWLMDPVLAYLQPKLEQLPPEGGTPNAGHALLTALVAAMSVPDKVSDLDAFPAWREAIPEPLE